jgi:hypothetical protein
VPKLAVMMDDAEADVLAYMSFPAAHRPKLRSTSSIVVGVLHSAPRGRPRGEERRAGCKRRRAA